MVGGAAGGEVATPTRWQRRETKRGRGMVGERREEH